MKGRLYYIALACLSLLLLWEVQDLAKFHTSTPPPNSDFSAYYLGAERLFADPATLYELEAPVHSAGYIYPPLSILLFLPFALFDYETAYLLFVSVIAIALVMSVWCVTRARQYVSFSQPADNHTDPDKHAKSALFALMVLSSGPAFNTSVSGQVNSIVLALCLGGVLLGLRRQHLLGGALLAFACWIKIYPVLLIMAMLSIKSQRKTALLSIAAGVLLPVAALPLVPAVVYDHYFLQLLPTLSGKILSTLSNQSITGSAVRLLLPAEQWLIWVEMDVPKWIRLLNAAILATVIAMFSFSRISRSPDVLLVAFLALAFIPLIAPWGWGHSFLFVIPLVAHCAVYGERLETRIVAIIAWLLLLVPAYSTLTPLRPLGGFIMGVLYFRYFIAASAVILVAVAWGYSTARGLSARPAPACSPDAIDANKNM
jgi:hypothetical protein